MDNEKQFYEWFSRFCERWNTLSENSNLKKIDKDKFKQGFLFRELFRKGCLFFLEKEIIAHGTPEEAADNLRAHIVNDKNGEFLALHGPASGKFCS